MYFNNKDTRNIKPHFSPSNKWPSIIKWTQYLKISDDGDITVRQKMRDSDDMHLTRFTVIVDDLILRSTITSLLLLLLKFYFRVYFKYRTILNLLKYDFLRKQFEFVGHDMPSNGNAIASCKYDLITDWHLPPNGDSLHAYISLSNFYDKVLPLFIIKSHLFACSISSISVLECDAVPKQNFIVIVSWVKLLLFDGE